MKYYYQTSDDISYLVSRFEHASSQKGFCLNLGENEFLDLVDHYEENFDKRRLFFELSPSLKHDIDVEVVVRYYGPDISFGA